MRLSTGDVKSQAEMWRQHADDCLRRAVMAETELALAEEEIRRLRGELAAISDLMRRIEEASL